MDDPWAVNRNHQSANRTGWGRSDRTCGRIDADPTARTDHLDGLSPRRTPPLVLSVVTAGVELLFCLALESCSPVAGATGSCMQAKGKTLGNAQSVVREKSGSRLEAARTSSTHSLKSREGCMAAPMRVSGLQRKRLRIGRMGLHQIGSPGSIAL